MTVTPLRRRRADILPLARYFLTQAAAQLRLPEAKALSRAAEATLLAHDWPGNARELRNAIIRATVISDELVEPGHLGLVDPLGERALDEGDEEPDQRVLEGEGDDESDERARIVRALARHAGNQSRAAQELGISRRNLLRKLDRHGIDRPRASAIASLVRLRRLRAG
jgi:DNA-binding NtrC family response regulator